MAQRYEPGEAEARGASASVRVGPPSGAYLMTESVCVAVVRLHWSGGHTVNAYLDRVEGGCETLYGLKPGAVVGCCSIGDFAQDHATFDDFYGCVRDFARDPWEHPLLSEPPR